MSGTPYELGQYAKVNAALSLALPKAIAPLDPKLVLGACEHGGERLSRLLSIAFDSLLKPEEKSELLKPTASFDLPEAATLFDPAIFETKLRGIGVWSRFRELVLRRVHKTKYTLRQPIAQYEPQVRLTDAEIEAELNERQYFDESQLCRIMLGMIEKQPNGKEGALSTHGANLFYTISGVVAYILWHDSTKEWGLDAIPRGQARWSAKGLRIFTAGY